MLRSAWPLPCHSRPWPCTLPREFRPHPGLAYGLFCRCLSWPGHFGTCGCAAKRLPTPNPWLGLWGLRSSAFRACPPPFRPLEPVPTPAARASPPSSSTHEPVFPMTMDRSELSRQREASAQNTSPIIWTEENVCFLTPGDPFLRSTCAYPPRAVRARVPGLRVVTVPGPHRARRNGGVIAQGPMAQARQLLAPRVSPASAALHDREKIISVGTCFLKGKSLYPVSTQLNRVLNLVHAMRGYLINLLISVG